MKIRILVTGGTFDKEYDELTGALFFRNTHLPEMLRLGRSKLDVLMQTVCMMDSLEMGAEQRAQDRRSHRGDGALRLRQLRRPVQPRQRPLLRPGSSARRLRRHERPLLRLGQRAQEPGRRRLRGDSVRSTLDRQLQAGSRE